MTSAIILVAITSVFHQGRIVQPDEEFACDLEHAKKLVKGGSARLKVEEKAQKNDENDDKNTDFSHDLKTKLEAITVPKLKELAQKHEIALDSDDLKPQIIEKIMAAGVILDEKENV